MTRDDYLRLAAAFLLPHTHWDVDRAIGYAERLWQRLAERGIGGAKADKTPKPRPHVDHCAALEPAQRRGFDRFWAAYGHKAGKQRACLRWAQIAPDEALAETIIQAASAARLADQQHPERVRKFAEGWLSERRWEDCQPAATPAGVDGKAAERRAIAAELAGLKRLNELAPHPDLAAKIAEIEARLCRQNGDG